MKYLVHIVFYGFLECANTTKMNVVVGNPPTMVPQLSSEANEKFCKLAVLLVKTGLSNGVFEPLAQSR